MVVVLVKFLLDMREINGVFDGCEVIGMGSRSRASAEERRQKGETGLPSVG